jgi:succinate dehydrogenase / fumarate reductase cytochrome b subunit
LTLPATETNDVLTRQPARRWDRNAPWWPANYRIGAWAFVLHRVTGLALVAYLFAHIWVISFAALVWGGLTFDRLMVIFEAPVIKALELGLVGLVLIHGLNGVRILLFDAGIGVRRQRLLFWIAIGLAAAIILAISGVTFSNIPAHK